MPGAKTTAPVRRAVAAATVAPLQTGDRIAPARAGRHEGFDFLRLAIRDPTEDKPPLQRKALPNQTGLPDPLKAGVERLSGIPMDDVRVHYNSTRPDAVQALAYTQGSEIHVGPGQERHLAHEAWHVVQQKQGRVRPTRKAQFAGLAVDLNEDRSLEAEADAMGPRAWSAAPGESIPRSGEATVTASSPTVQRIPVREDAAARLQVTADLAIGGYGAVEATDLCDRIGSLTIRDDVQTNRLIALLNAHGGNIALVSDAINKGSMADVNHLANNPGQAGLLAGTAALRLPTDPEVDRYYTNYLRTRLAAGPVVYAANLYTNFRQSMRDHSGQYWDFGAAGFQRVTEAYRDIYVNAGPVPAAAFCNDIYGGQNVDFVGHAMIPRPGGWIFNPAEATGYELRTFLLNVPAGFGRPFTAQMRTAIGHVNARPQAAQQIIALAGPNLVARLAALLDAVAGAAQPAHVLQVLNLVLNPPVGAPVATGFPLALAHLDLLELAFPHLNPLTNNMPFGNRAGGLRGHFIRHVLGMQLPPHDVAARAEAHDWMAAALLNLAPNGLITHADFVNLPPNSQEEWEIFGQHACLFVNFAAWRPNLNGASTPTNAAEMDAMIDYLRTPGNGAADAVVLANAHENPYQTHVSQQFDAAAPNRFLYFSAHNLKVNAFNGQLFMVAAWNGADFDLSTGFLIPGAGAQAQYNSDIADRMMNV